VYLFALLLSEAHVAPPNQQPFYKAGEDKQLPQLLENASLVHLGWDSIGHVRAFRHKHRQVAQKHFCLTTTSSVFSVYHHACNCEKKYYYLALFA
jgi:UDP-N-acetyl-D-mannosaminuronic acid transferase (WecB/TagA/CpsF family)